MNIVKKLFLLSFVLILSPSCALIAKKDTAITRSEKLHVGMHQYKVFEIMGEDFTDLTTEDDNTKFKYISFKHRIRSYDCTFVVLNFNNKSGLLTEINREDASDHQQCIDKNRYFVEMKERSKRQFNNHAIVALVGVAAIGALALPATNSGYSSPNYNIKKQPASIYEENCPCPYNIASDGSRCGDRSAYVRTGGASPACY